MCIHILERERERERERQRDGQRERYILINFYTLQSGAVEHGTIVIFGGVINCISIDGY